MKSYSVSSDRVQLTAIETAPGVLALRQFQFYPPDQISSCDVQLEARVALEMGEWIVAWARKHLATPGFTPSDLDGGVGL